MKGTCEYFLTQEKNVKILTFFGPHGLKWAKKCKKTGKKWTWTAKDRRSHIPSKTVSYYRHFERKKFLVKAGMWKLQQVEKWPFLKKKFKKP